MDVVRSLDPNIKFDATNPTPAWNYWRLELSEPYGNAFQQNLFGQIRYQQSADKRGLLERCAYVVFHLLSGTMRCVI
jgi:hypothetical protein